MPWANNPPILGRWRRTGTAPGDASSDAAASARGGRAGVARACARRLARTPSPRWAGTRPTPSSPAPRWRSSTSTSRSRCSTAARADVDALFERALRLVLDAAVARPAELRRLDRRREIDPGWFQRTRMQGYVCYVDQFCGTLAELPHRLDYLGELGTTYLHLMPLLKPRPGENDGGYAVMDYRAVDPRLGTMADLESVAEQLHARGMSLCIDLVLNHTAREHPWAQAWLAGDPEYAGFYTAFPDREMPDAYDATIPEVFPDRAPGSFSWVPEACGGCRRLGVDDVLAVPVGPRLHQPRRDPGDARRDHLAGQPRRRRLPHGRRAVHVEAAGHQLPEPARGPHAAPAAARTHPAGRAGRRLQGRGDRVAGGPGALPRRPRAVPAGVRAGLPQPAHGDAVEQPRHPGRPARRPRPRAACRRSRRPPRGSPTCAGTTTSAGRSATSTPGRSAPAASGTGSSSTTSSAGASRGPSRAGRCSRRTRRPGTPGSRARRPRSAASRTRSSAGTTRRWSRPSAASCCSTPSPTRSGASRCSTWATNWRCATTPATSPTRRGPGQPLDAPPAHGLDGGRAAHATRPSLEGRVFGWLQRLGEVRRALPALRGGGECTVLDVGNDAVLAWRRRNPRSGSFVGLANVSPAAQTVDADTVTGFGSFEPVLASDGPPELRADRVLLPGLGFAWYAER